MSYINTYNAISNTIQYGSNFLLSPAHLVNNQLVLALSKIHILASVVILGHLHAKNYLNNSNFEACLLPIDVEVNRCTRVLDLYREDNLDMMGWWDISLPTNRLQADSFKGV